jgi:hypothetical protein
MDILGDVDPVFMWCLASLAGSDEELAFERRGQGASTYPLHGKVVSVDLDAETIRILRTRTHVGEVHEMGLRYFLNATRSAGEVLVNRVTTEQNNAFEERQQARESAVTAALANPFFRPPERQLRSKYVGTRTGNLEGVPPDRFVFQDKERPERTVGLVARSLDAARNFMAMQDLFLPLEDMFWHATNGRILWPAFIALSRIKCPAASSSFRWLEIYPLLDGLSPACLGFYMERFHSNRLGVRALGSLTEADVQALRDRKLLFSKTTTSFQLVPPIGVTTDDFRLAVSELRDSIHMMRNWLRATYDFYGEDEIEQLARVS